MHYMIGVRIFNEARSSGRAGRHRPVGVDREAVDNCRRLGPETARQSRPETGDLLVSKRTARSDVYMITVVPGEVHAKATRYEEAIEAARELARHMLVDAWYTEDHTHVRRIARHRQPPSPTV